MFLDSSRAIPYYQISVLESEKKAIILYGSVILKPSKEISITGIDQTSFLLRSETRCKTETLCHSRLLNDSENPNDSKTLSDTAAARQSEDFKSKGSDISRRFMVSDGMKRSNCNIRTFKIAASSADLVRISSFTVDFAGISARITCAEQSRKIVDALSAPFTQSFWEQSKQHTPSHIFCHCSVVLQLHMRTAGQRKLINQKHLGG
jgi:hypothetical protein